MSDDAKWDEDVAHALVTLTDLCQAVMDDNFEIVQCQADTGKEFIGVEVDGQVLVVVVPANTPQQRVKGTLQ